MIKIKYYIISFAPRIYRKFVLDEIVHSHAEFELKRKIIADHFKVKVKDVTFVFIEHDVKLDLEALKNVQS